MKLKQKVKRIIAFVLAFTLLMGLVTITPIDRMEVFADSTEGKPKISLGTSAIARPTAPGSSGDAWRGDYVYFGTYVGEL